MAELLLYYKSRGDDPVPDDPARRFGDIIHALPDGATWGGRECLEDFVVVRVPEMALEDAQGLASPYYDADGRCLAQSRYCIDLNAALDYDVLASLYVADWHVPEVDAAHIMDKAAS